MDKTETYKWYEDPVYIKMCEKAEEIQAYKTHRQTDMYLHKGLDGDEVMAGYNLIYVANSIWLPTQEDLQEMVSQELSLEGQEWNFHVWVMEGRQATIFTSMNQLWLAFYMSEKYNKTWTGEKWEVRC